MHICRLTAFVAPLFLLAACSPNSSPPTSESAQKPAVKPASSDPKGDVADDLRRLQGIWEREVRPEENVPYMRVTKIVDGNRERVIYYNADGSVYRAHEVQFQLERQGRVKVFTFWDQVITEGPDKGKRFPDRKSFIYRSTQDTFDEVWGFLSEQVNRPITYHVHRRVRPETAATRPGTTLRVAPGTTR